MTMANTSGIIMNQYSSSHDPQGDSSLKFLTIGTGQW